MAFLMIAPNLNNFNHTVKYEILGLSIAAFLLVIVSIRNVAVLGIGSPLNFSDTYEAFRLIDFGNIFTSMNLFSRLYRYLLLKYENYL